MDAVILKNGLAVRVNSQKKDYNLSNKNFSVSGFLIEFSIDAEVFHYYYDSDFKKEDEKKSDKAGYYNKDQFLKYKEYKNLVTYENLIGNYKLSYDKFEIANPNDILDIEEVVYLNPFDSYYIDKISKFKIVSRTNFLNANYRIEVPVNVESGLISISTEDRLLDNSITGKFYHNNLSQTIRNSDNASQFAEIVTLIAFKISFIIKDVFPLLQTQGNSDINTLINNILSQWQNQALLPEEPIVEDFLLYYNIVSNFYTSCMERRDTLSQSNPEEKILILLKILPPAILSNSDLVSLEIKHKALKQLALQDVIWNDDEELALKIINSIHIDDQQEVDEFLGWLIDEKFPTGKKLPPYQETVYSLLYEKIDNYSTIVKMIPELFGNQEFSKDNQTRFINSILGLWTESKYNPYKNESPDYSLIDNGTYNYDKNYQNFAIIHYKSKKNFFGVYDDVFTFHFSPWADGIYFTIDEKGGIITPRPIMHTYQPLTLIHYPSETDTSIQLPEKDGELNGVVPLFFLKYVDDHGDNQDFETKVGILIDVATTATGIGNLAKLRHLRHLSKLGQVFIIIEGVQITAGVVSFLLNFVDGCDDSPFCKKLKTVLFFVEITALVTDPIAAYKTKKAAQEAIETATTEGWPSSFLNEIDGTTPKGKIEELSELNIPEYLLKYKNKIKSDFNFRISKNSDLFENIHSSQQIDNFIDLGFEKGLSNDEILGLLYISCRKEKPIPYNELITQMSNWTTIIKPRKFPYKFNTIDDFIIFKNKMKAQLQDWDIPFDDVRIQGSSLRNPLSKDVDVAIMVSESDVYNIKNKIIERYRNSFTLNGKFEKDKFDKAVEKLNDQISKGFIKNRQFGLLEGQTESFMTELYEIRNTYPIGESLDVSIIIKGKGFDTPPYIKF